MQCGDPAINHRGQDLSEGYLFVTNLQGQETIDTIFNRFTNLPVIKHLAEVETISS